MRHNQRDRAAQLIVEASIDGTQAVAERYGVSERSLYRYRARIDTDPELARIVSEKKARLEGEWAAGIPGALKAAVKYLKGAAERAESDELTPDMVAAIAGAMKLLSETAGTWKVLELRIAKSKAAADEAARQQVTAPVVPLRRVNGMNGNGASHG